MSRSFLILAALFAFVSALLPTQLVAQVDADGVPQLQGLFVNDLAGKLTRANKVQITSTLQKASMARKADRSSAFSEEGHTVTVEAWEAATTVVAEAVGSFRAC